MIEDRDPIAQALEDLRLKEAASAVAGAKKTLEENARETRERWSRFFSEIGMNGPLLAYLHMKYDGKGGAELTGTLNIVSNSRILELPPGLHLTNGNLQITYCENFHTLPADLSVNGDLDVRGCFKLQSVPAGMNISGSIIMNGNQLALNQDCFAKGYRIEVLP